MKSEVVMFQIKEIFSALYPISPILWVALGGVACLLLAAKEKKTEEEYRNSWPHMVVALFFTFIAVCALPAFLDQSKALLPESISSLFTFDELSFAGSSLILLIALLAILTGASYMSKQAIVRGEYFALILFSSAGMMMLISAVEILTFFIALEVMSLAIYVLVGFKRADRFSQEAALKYFISGAFASAIFFFGAGLVYGATGTTEIGKMIPKIAIMSKSGMPALFITGATLCLCSFLFKMAAVPFHMWAPDAYQGAPTVVTAFMAAGVKVSAFLAFYRFGGLHLTVGLFASIPHLIKIIEIVAIITMIIGNLMAVLQTHLKRMLAYSSIANAGYLLVGLIAVLEGDLAALKNIIFFLIIYSLSTFGIFSIIAFLERENARMDEQRIQNYSGYGFQYPLLGLLCALFMFALAGIPPTAGFMGKLMLLTPVLQKGHYVLVLTAVLTSVVSVYYYLSVVVAFFMQPKKEYQTTNNIISTAFNASQAPLYIALVICAYMLIHAGVLPENLLRQIMVLH